MSWYAIRTMPGAQMPKREYWPVSEDEEGNPLRGKKGYRIVSGANPDYSAVELALKDKGLSFYMPVEYAAVRNRHKKHTYELRRFAMLKGYMFVEAVDDPDCVPWSAAIGVNGVRGFVADYSGRPFAISTMDLHRLRMIEDSSRREAEAKVKSLSTATERIAREQRKTAARGAKRKLFPGRPVKLIWGEHVGRDAVVQSWADQDMVRALLTTLDGASETITVPYEFLKIAV